MLKKLKILFVIVFSLVYQVYAAENNSEEPKNSEFYFQRGLQAYRVKDYKSAVNYFTQTVLLEPTNEQAKKYLHKSAKYAHIQQYKQKQLARKKLPKPIQKDLAQKDKIKILLKKAELAKNKEDYRQAYHYFQQLLAVDPSNSEYVTELQVLSLLREAKTYENKGLYLQANDKYYQVLNLEAENSSANKGIEKIQIELEKILNTNKDISLKERYYIEGFFYFNQKQFSNAVTTWEKTFTAETPKDSAAGKLTLEERIIQKYLTLSKNILNEENRKKQVNQYLQQGLAFYSKGKYKEASTSFQEVLKLDPENKEAKEHLNSAKNELKKQHESAVKTKLLQEIKDYLEQGINLYKQSYYAQALTVFDEILKLDPTNLQALEYQTKCKEKLAPSKDPKEAEKHYQQGLVYYAGGQLESAKNEFELTLRLYPEHEKAKQALEKVRKELELTPQ